MPPDIPIHRRQSDQLIEMLVNQAREDREEAREWRVQAMIKLESLPVLVITQASHGLRLDKLEPRVDQTERRMDRAKWTLVGAFGSGGLLGAGSTKALIAWLASLGH